MLSSAGRLRDYLLASIALGTGPRSASSILWKLTKNIRVRLKLAAHRPEQIYALETIYGPLYFRDNFGDITNLVDLFYHQTYRAKKLAREGSILDIGANIGLAAAWFAYHNPGRTIYCFEPLREHGRLIKLNCPHAEVSHIALGARQSRVKLHLDPDRVMASRIGCRWQTQEKEFGVRPLDEFARARGLEAVALAKIDTEGMEVDVLQGARETLERTHQVVMETHAESLHRQAIAYLRRSGFCIDEEHFPGRTGLVFASRSPDR